jgi:hypothetical protein
MLEHLKYTGKPCFVHYINLSGNRLCGFTYRDKLPVFTEESESEEGEPSATGGGEQDANKASTGKK